MVTIKKLFFGESLKETIGKAEKYNTYGLLTLCTIEVDWQLPPGGQPTGTCGNAGNAKGAKGMNPGC